ncbi:MAG TPA: vWA domain-containing protein [Planctomycetota bacterium]|nr:vWA domain-containing protein [Planctomycetota bacterium]
MSFQLIPILPLWLIVPVTAGLLALLVIGSRILVRKRVPARWICLLAALRVAIVAIFLACLLQPVTSCTKATAPEPHVLVLVDTSRSMAAADTPDGRSRLAAVTDPAALHKVLGNLPEQCRVDWFAFDADARPVTLGDVAALQPNGAATNLAAGIASAYSHYREEAASRGAAATARVVAATDGNDFSDPIRAARRLGLIVDVLQPPVRTTPAPDHGPRVAIVSVNNPRRVLLGGEARLLATLRQDQPDAQTVDLNLTEDGQPVRSFPVAFADGELEKHASLAFRPEKAGVHTYRLSVGNATGNPANDAPGLAAVETTIQVISRKYEVLLLEDTWRWDLKFLCRIFEDDPHFNFTAFVARGRNAFVQLAEPDRSVELGGFPSTWPELAAFDMIVLGDVDPARWPDGMAGAVRRLVADEGRSLIVIAGPNLPKLARQPDLESLLPVAVPETLNPADGPVPVRVSIEGAASSFFFRGEDSADSLWRNLPPMDQVYPPLRKKPGATVLVEASQLANDHGNVAVVAEQTVGRGHTLFIGTDTLWKWQTLGPRSDSGQTPYSVFWQQALRAMAPDRPNAVLDVQPDGWSYRAGQAVKLHARLNTDARFTRLRIRGTVKTPDGREIRLQFMADALRPSERTASFAADVPGQYTVSVSAETEGKVAADVSTVINVLQPPGEDTDAGVNHAALSALARETGGREIDPADPKTWPAIDEAALQPVQQARMFDLWSNFTLLSVLAAALALDWLLRLWRGYF